MTEPPVAPLSSPVDFQAWADDQVRELSPPAWGDRLWSLVAPSSPSAIGSPDRRLWSQIATHREITHQVLWQLLSRGAIAPAQTLATALLTEAPTPRHTWLTPAERLHLWQSAAQYLASTTPPQPAALTLHQQIFEWDTSDQPALRALLSHALTTDDEWSATLYAQALSESLVATPPADPTFLRSLLKRLLAQRYLEAFFGLADTYVSLVPAADQTALSGAIALIAQSLVPEEDLYPDWQPQAIVGPAAVAIFRPFVYDLNASLPVAQSLARLGQQAPSGSVDQLEYWAEAASYFGLAGQVATMQQMVQQLQRDWPLARLSSGLSAVQNSLAAPTLSRSGDSDLERPALESLEPDWPEFEHSELERVAFALLFRLAYCLPYITPQRRPFRQWQEAAAALYSAVQRQKLAVLPLLPPAAPRRGAPLRVGYLSATFRRHAVGFLAHETLAQHDPNQVQTFLYNLGASTHDPIRASFAAAAQQFRELGGISTEGAIAQIRADQLDLLVFLDTTTSSQGCAILASRVAPAQLSWLGGDGPGIADYVLGDPHLFPPTAQGDYGERLLRLPSFVAVGQMPCAVINQAAFRQSLQLPPEAVVLWTAAIGFKRHPECLAAQLEILQQVPAGILVVKGFGDLAALGQTLQAAAVKWGVADRVRLLAYTPTPEEHRAQLQMADLVLDTFPYTGATHSLEALYYGVPVLTCVGEHYYSRMTYSLLQTIGGLEACITTSTAAYIQQGIWLGQNQAARQALGDRLRQTHGRSLLWHPREQARSLERAFRQVTQGLPTADFVASPPRPEPCPQTAPAWAEAARQAEHTGTQHPATCQAHWESALRYWQQALILTLAQLPESLTYQWAELKLRANLGESVLIRAIALWTQYLQAEHPELYLLTRWLAEHSGVMYRPEARRFWELCHHLNPQDHEATLVLALTWLRQQRPEGLHLLRTIPADVPEFARATTLRQLVAQQQGEAEPAPLTTLYEGYQFVLEPSLASIGTTVLLAQGRWFEAEIEFCRQFLQPGMVVFDVGANLGVYTCLAARCVGPTGQVYAIEPSPTCTACLQATIAQNALSHVTLIAAAAGDTLGTVNLDTQAASVFHQVTTQGPGLAVPQVTLDHLWSQAGRPPVHFLKIDTEGAEAAVLRGAATLIEQRQPVILFENVGGAEATGAEASAWLLAHGYTLHTYQPGLQTLRPLRSDQPLNVIALPPSRL